MNGSAIVHDEDPAAGPDINNCSTLTVGESYGFMPAGDPVSQDLLVAYAVISAVTLISSFFAVFGLFSFSVTSCYTICYKLFNISH